MPQPGEKSVIILGAGGHGCELSNYLPDCVSENAHLRLVGFIDEFQPPGPWNSSRILGNFDALKNWISQNPDTKIDYITAVGDNAIRHRFVEKIEELNHTMLQPFTLKHETAYLSENSHVGAGTCLCPGSIVTVGCLIGEHCIVNVNASISHDSEVGNFCNVNPGVTICGNVRIGAGCFIGAGVTILEKITIGEGSIIGAGAVVTRDIPSGVTAYGVPARVVKKNQNSG